jgi:hypothetical protein
MVTNWHAKKKGWMGAVLSLACALWLAILGSGWAEATSSGQTRYAAFPLYKDVSGSNPFATLGEGRLSNGTRWGVWASRVGKGRPGYERPCLSLARITRDGLYGDRHMCGKLIPTDETPPKPVYVSIGGSYTSKPGGSVTRETVIGLSFGPAVRSVVLTYTDGRQLHRRTRFFNVKQQHKTRLPAFRYIALALREDVCVDTVIGYADTGSELFSAKTRLCF